MRLHVCALRVRDGGQASVLMLGFVVVLVGLVGLGVDVGGAALMKQRLQGDADAAALAAATAVDPAWVAGSTAAPLHPTAARGEASEALERRDSVGELTHLEVSGVSVSVTVTDRYRPALLGLLGLGTSRLDAHATATLRSA